MKVCPVCHGDFNKKNIEGRHGAIELDACEGCGSIWFDNQELRSSTHIEDLISHAATLDNEKVKHCPRCGALLKPKHKATATHNISEYRCSDCRGELVIGVTMKKKAATKMGLLLTTAGLVMVGLFSYLTVNLNTSTEIRATDVISWPLVTQISSSEISITFTTSSPVRSELIFSSPYLTSERRVVVSDIPSTVHQLTLDGLLINQEHSYRIVVLDAAGTEQISSEHFYTPISGPEVD